MEDKEIVELYWERNECAIKETSAKYGRYCFQIAFNILLNKEDADESVNDTWFKTWECISAGNEMEKSIEHKELLRLLNAFLGTLPETERDLLVCRYWFLASIQELSEKFSFSKSKTKSMLFRTRKKLQNCLEKEGYLS